MSKSRLHNSRNRALFSTELMHRKIIVSEMFQGEVSLCGAFGFVFWARQKSTGFNTGILYSQIRFSVLRTRWKKKKRPPERP